MADRGPVSAYGHIRRVQNRSDQYDMHEMMKQEIVKQDINQQRGVGGNEDLTYSSSTANKSAKTAPVTVENNYGFGDIEVYLDSIYRSRTTDTSTGEITWNITSINNNVEISNIIEMSIDDFFIPKINVETTYPDFFYFRKVYIEATSASSQQAINGPNGQRFHWECNVENINGQAVKLIPTKGTFFFSRPLNSLAELQLRFMVPQTTLGITSMKRIPLPNAVVTVRMLTTGGFGYNPIRFEITTVDATATSVLAVVGSTSSSSNPGIAVILSGFLSNDAGVNAEVNDQSGVFVTNVIDSTTFEIDGIDSTTVNDNYTANMYVLKNRIAFPIRFTTISTSITNHMNVGHL